MFLMAALAAALWCGRAQALPFNDDMVNSQIKTGQMVRGRVPGTVPLGSLSSYVENKEDAKLLSNPIRADSKSAERGERLFRVNCVVCHGIPMKEGHQNGTITPFMIMPAPNLASPIYDENPDGGSRTDGELFGVVHFGGLVFMPGLGWKLSHSETWDIVNFIRKQQSK